MSSSAPGAATKTWRKPTLAPSDTSASSSIPSFKTAPKRAVERSALCVGSALLDGAKHRSVGTQCVTFARSVPTQRFSDSPARCARGWAYVIDGDSLPALGLAEKWLPWTIAIKPRKILRYRNGRYRFMRISRRHLANVHAEIDGHGRQTRNGLYLTVKIWVTQRGRRTISFEAQATCEANGGTDRDRRVRGVARRSGSEGAAVCRGVSQQASWQ